MLFKFRGIISSVATIAITIQVSMAWEKYYGTDHDDYGQSVCEDIYFDGGYVIGGTTVYSESNFDAYLVSIDPNGNLEWANNYGCPESLEILYSVQETQDGGFVASGEVWPLNTVNEYCQRGLIMKTNYFGNIEWMFHKQEGFRTYSSFVYIPEEENITLTGWTKTVGSVYKVFWRKYPMGRGPSQEGYDSTYIIGGHQHAEGHCIQKASDGYIIVGGIWQENVGSGHQNCDVYLIKTNESGSAHPQNGGAQVKFGDPNNDDIGYCVQQTLDGGYIIVGGTRSYGAGGWDVYLVKTNAQLGFQWQKTYGGTRDDIGYSVQQTPDSGYTICGSTQSFSDDKNDVYYLKVDKYGNKLFEKTFGKPQFHCYGASIKLTSNGGYVIAGTERYAGAVPANSGDEIYCIYADPVNAPILLCYNPVVYGGLLLHWADNSTNEIRFEIDRKIGESGVYTTIGTTDANTTSYYDAGFGLYYGQEVYYRVRAISEANSSSPSNELVVKIPGPGIFSDTISAIDYYHSSRNLKRDNTGNYHLILKHHSRLWYTKSTDNGQTWQLARNLSWSRPIEPSAVFTSTGLPCFVWQEVSGSTPNLIYDLVYAYIDASGNIHKTTLIDNADHALSPAIAITTDNYIHVAFVHTYAQNSAGKITALRFNYDNPQYLVFREFTDCDLARGIRIDTDIDNNPHLAWAEAYTVWGGNPIHAAQVGRIYHGWSDGTNILKEVVAQGWITQSNLTYCVSGSDIQAFSLGNMKFAWILTRTYPSPAVKEIYYRTKSSGVWSASVNVTQDPDIGNNPGFARIIGNTVFCSANNKIFVCYPIRPDISSILIENAYNYDAIGIGSNAAIVYTGTSGIPALYHICFTIKVVPIPPYQNVDVVYASPPGPSPEFTCYNNTRRLLRDTKGVLHLTLTISEAVYHTYLQDAIWSEPVMIGTGKYPALALGPDGKIHCIYSYHGYEQFAGQMWYVEYLMMSAFDGLAWSEPTILFHTYDTFLWGVGAPSLAISDTMAYVTFKSYHGPGPNPPPGAVPPQVIVVEGPALFYGKFPLNNPSAFTYDIIDTITKEQTSVDTLTYRDSLVPLLVSPSITVDMAGVPHILWEGDSTCMRYYTINDTIATQFFDSEVDFPWLTMNGDQIQLFWTARDSIRYCYGWTGKAGLNQIQTVATCESPFSSGSYLTWTKKEGGLSHLYYGAIPASGPIAPIEVNYSTDLISYPQLLYNPPADNKPASLDLVWTEYSLSDSLGYVYYLNLLLEKVAPAYAFDMGQETPVPILIEREGYITLGPEDYQTFDYDSTELVNHMTLHSPHTKYKIRWTYYHQEPDKIKLQFNVDDILSRNHWVNPGEKIVEEAWIPDACLLDNEITIRVKNLSGTIAVLSGFEIETHTIGGGGPQGSEIQISRPFFFERMYPNPTKGVLKIRFNSPGENKVTIAIYDIAGRIVKKVFDGTAIVGMNELSIRIKDLSAGVYFVRLEAEDYTRTEKVILLQ